MAFSSNFIGETTDEIQKSGECKSGRIFSKTVANVCEIRQYAVP